MAGSFWRQLCRPRRGADSGAVAVQFAVLGLPLAVMSFGMVDLSRASASRQRLQDALDAAALMAARSNASTDADLQAIGAPFLASTIGTQTGVTLTGSTFTGADSKVVATASLKVTPVIANLWLNGDMTITVNSEVMRSVNKIEVALVLDNTGSMAQTLGSSTKISALKTASSSLVDTLAAAAARSSDPNAVKFAVAPFSMTVNVGSSYQTAAWMSGTQPNAYGADLFTTAQDRFALLTAMGLKWGGCVESRPAPYDIQETAPASNQPATLFVPYFAPDEPDANKVSYTSGGRTYYYSFTNNYITNDKTSATDWQMRQGNPTKYGKSNLSSSASGTSIGPNKDCALTPILRLTTNATTVKSTLNAMTTVGNTNVPMGLMWGWHLLSPNGPFADGKAYGTDKLSKVIVLLTDGDNTNDEESNPEDSIYTGIGYIWQKRLADSNGTPLDVGSTGTDRMNALDGRESKICANIKAQGIIIYAIGVGVSTHSKSLLAACASSSDKYYDVTNASQLSGVFNAIAGSIDNLRISK